MNIFKILKREFFEDLGWKERLKGWTDEYGNFVRKLGKTNDPRFEPWWFIFLIQRFFVECPQWCRVPGTAGWVPENVKGAEYYQGLPDVLTNFPNFQDYAIEWLKGKGYSYFIFEILSADFNGPALGLENEDGDKYEIEIHEDNWLEAFIIGCIWIAREEKDNANL